MSHDSIGGGPFAAASTRAQQRFMLWVVLGGLLVLLVSLGTSAISFLKKIESRHEAIRSDFVSRLMMLEQLRNDVYRSGTRVHDFLLEEDTARADQDRHDVLASRQRIEDLESEYARSLRPEERELFVSLRREVTVYFGAVTPVLGWSRDERHRRVDIFVRDELHPRRSVMLRIADEIETLNRQEMDRNSADTQALFVSYRWLLFGLVSVTIAIGALLAAFSIARITRLENETEARVRQVEHAKAELQALSVKLVEAQETERQKLSRELHDEIGQGLWAMVLGLGNITAALDHGQLAEAREHLHGARRLADGMVHTVRNLALVLRPSLLDDLGLVPAVKWLAREVARSSDLHVEVSASGVQDTLLEEHRTCIYRIVQEALRNCQRHAHARVANVRLFQDQRALHLTVTDDGAGFEPSEDRGLGVLGMEERVTHLGGTFRMRSAPGAGTRIDVDLPLEPAIA